MKGIRNPVARFRAVRALWTACTTALLPLVGFSQTALGDRPNAAPQDGTTVVFKAGDNSVSKYIFERDLMRHLNASKGRGVQYLYEESTAQWLSNYKAKQIIVGELLAQGVQKRPEVQAEVERMTTNMLSMEDGPLYHCLAEKDGAVSQAREIELCNEANELFRVTIVRFESKRLEDGHKDALERLLQRTDAAENLAALRGVDGIQIVSGWLAWPFGDLIELADWISALPEHSWARRTLEGGEVFYAYKDEVAKLGPAPDPASIEGFKAFSDRVRLRQLRATRRREVATQCSFRLSPHAADQLRAWKDPPNLLSQSSFQGAGAGMDELFSYSTDGKSVSVDLAEFAKYYAGLYLQPRVESLADLKAAAEDMLLQRTDLDLARSLGLDRTWQFADERKTYEGVVALGYYEERSIRPELGIREEDCRNWYVDHKSEFYEPVRAKVRIVSFDSPVSACLWGQEQSGGLPSNRAAHVPVSDRVDECLESSPELQVGGLGHAVLLAEAGQRFGPIPIGERSELLVRLSTLEMGYVPYENVRARIRGMLEEQAQDRREVSIAESLRKTLSVVDDTANCLPQGEPRGGPGT